MNTADPEDFGAARRGPWIVLASQLATEDAWRRRVVTEISDAIAREIPALGRDGELRQAMRESVEDNASLFATMAARSQDPTTAEPPALAVAFVRLLVHRGLPPETLVQTYRIAHGAFWRTLVGELRSAIADPTALATALEHGAAYMFAFIDALTDAAQRRYAEERARWVQSADAVRARTVRELLDGVPLDPAAAGRRLRYALDREHLAVVAWHAGSGGGEDAAIERELREALAPLEAGPPLVTAVGPGVVGAWVGQRGGFAPDVVRALRRPSRPKGGAGTGGSVASAERSGPGTTAAGPLLAVGGPAAGPDGFRLAHVEAAHARRVAQLQVAPPGSIVHYADVAVAALATGDHEQARRFVAAQLGPLAGDGARARRLASTLEVFLQERSSPRRTAERLGVHENTAAARIRTAEGLLPGPIEGRVTELLLALRLAPIVRGGPG